MKKTYFLVMFPVWFSFVSSIGLFLSSFSFALFSLLSAWCIQCSYLGMRLRLQSLLGFFIILKLRKTFFEESWQKTGWVTVSVNCFKSAMTRWLDSPLVFQNEYVTDKTCVGKTGASTWQRDSRAAEFECEKGERSVLRSSRVYSVF